MDEKQMADKMHDSYWIGYELGRKAGYAEGITTARKEFEKNLDEAEQKMLEGMARDHEKEAKEFYADKTH
jgi:hypothetical protein